MSVEIRPNLSVKQRKEMLKMLDGLSAAERRMLKNPDFITEDEADVIISERRCQEPGIPVEEVFREFGYTPHHRQKTA